MAESLLQPAIAPPAALEVDIADAVAPSADLRWLAVGGGPTPSSNEVSIEADVALARRTYGPRGHVLFAGGRRSDGVRVAGTAGPSDPLLSELGDLFAPRDGRADHYRPARLAADGPADLDHVLEVLEAVVAVSSGPLIVHFAGHGDKGQTANGNAILLWGQTALTVQALANLLDRAARRPLRIVATTCFSGGLGELAFRGADPANGPADPSRCGLFAATWDLEASGCDPNPDRRAHAGFAVHFLNALAGVDRDGAPLPPNKIDHDGDGQTSLLEAHAWARVVARSLDVPTTTSERWLREAAPTEGPSLAVDQPEDRFVIVALGADLGLADEAQALASFERLEAAAREAEAVLADAEAEESAAAARVGGSLLARWPTMDDPWRSDFAGTLQRHRLAITAFLRGNPLVSRWRALRAVVGRRADDQDQARLASARVERLVRAWENVRLAALLRGSGGPGWQQYEQLLACERTVP